MPPDLGVCEHTHRTLGVCALPPHGLMIPSAPTSAMEATCFCVGGNGGVFNGIEGFLFRTEGRLQGSGFTVWDLGFRVQSLGLWVLDFGVWFLELKVRGLRFGV